MINLQHVFKISRSDSKFPYLRTDQKLKFQPNRNSHNPPYIQHESPQS